MKLYQPPLRPEPGGEREFEMCALVLLHPSISYCPLKVTYTVLIIFQVWRAHYGEIMRIINMSRNSVCLFICLCLSFSLSVSFRDPGTSRTTIKRLNKEKAIEAKWEQFIAPPKVFSSKSALSRWNVCVAAAPLELCKAMCSP